LSIIGYPLYLIFYKEGTVKTIADIVNGLFATYLRPDGQEYSNAEVSRALKGELSRGYLSKLRAGEIPNPGRNALLALCRFFDQPPSVFFPELQEELTEEVDSLPLRTTGLTPEARRYVEGIVDLLRQARVGKPLDEGDRISEVK
jgi:transcriptional regulator with XRE-family HTH domain